MAADDVVHGITLQARGRLAAAMARHGLSADERIAIFEDAGLNDPPERST